MAVNQELPEDGTQRMPYWLAAADRSEAGSAIAGMLGAQPPCSDEQCLRAVLDELAIAAVREQMWPSSAAAVRCAEGYAADVLPIRLGELERRAVLALPGLSAALRCTLDDGRRER